jgi:hypothetical protein
MRDLILIVVFITTAYSVRYKEFMRCITLLRGSGNNFFYSPYIMLDCMRNHFPHDPSNLPYTIVRIRFITWYGENSPCSQVQHIKDLVETSSEAMISSNINYFKIPKKAQREIEVPKEVLDTIPKEKSRAMFAILMYRRGGLYEDIKMGYLEETFQRDYWVISGILHAIEAWNKYLRYRYTLPIPISSLLHFEYDFKDFQVKISFILDVLDNAVPLLFTFNFGFNSGPIIAVLFLYIYLQLAFRINNCADNTLLERIKEQHQKFYDELKEFTIRCTENRTLVGMREIEAWNCENLVIYPINTSPEVFKNYKFCEKLVRISLYKVKFDRVYLRDFIRLKVLGPKKEFISICCKMNEKKAKSTATTYHLIINSTDPRMDIKVFAKLTELIKNEKVLFSELNNILNYFRVERHINE